MSSQVEMTPIPQPAEIVAFLVRNFSHVDDASEGKLKKQLQRLRKDGRLSVNVAMELLDERLAPLIRASKGLWSISPALHTALKDYVELCLSLDCGALPAEAIRRLFDRLAVATFEFHFEQVLVGSDIAPGDVLGKPEEAMRKLWEAKLKNHDLKTVACELERTPGLARGETNWEERLEAWRNGDNNMQIVWILKLLEHWDLRFGYALLLCHAYRNYCKLSNVVVELHGLGYGISVDEVQAEIAALMRGEAGQACQLPSDAESDVILLHKLVDPRRPKAPGEAKQARGCIERIETALGGEPRLAGLGVLRGRYEIQMGHSKEALAEFEKAAEWFAFRSAVQMKISLHHLLNLAAKHKDQHCLKRWQGWSSAMQLDVDIGDPEIAVVRDFPEPFPEAGQRVGAHPTEKHVICLDKWENKKPALQNPDQVCRGYGPTRSPQLAIFASLGQSEKVHVLLMAGADPDKLDDANGSALLNAIQGCDNACVERLLSVSSTAVINARTSKGTSPLHEAVSARRPDWVKALIDRGADVELIGRQGQTPLYSAISLFASAEQMVAGLMDPEMIEGHLERLPAPLRPSSSPFRKDQTQALLQKFRSNQHLLSVFAKEMAPKMGDDATARSIVRHLLDAGADINAFVDEAKLTPFLYAAEIGNRWLLNELHDHGADVRSCDGAGATVFARLNYFGHSALAQEFLKWVEPEDRLWLREKKPSWSRRDN